MLIEMVVTLIIGLFNAFLYILPNVNGLFLSNFVASNPVQQIISGMVFADFIFPVDQFLQLLTMAISIEFAVWAWFSAWKFAKLVSMGIIKH